MVKACSLIPTGIKLLINLHCPDFHHCHLGPTLFWTWWHIQHQRLSRKSKTLCFWWRSCYRMSDLWHLPKLACLFHGEWGQIIQGIVSNCTWQTNYTRPFTPSQGYPWCLTTPDTFSGYTVAVPVWAVGSGHTRWLLKLSCVICLAFRTICSLIMMHQKLFNWLLVKVLLKLPSSLPSTDIDIVENYNSFINYWLKKISDSTSLTSSLSKSPSKAVWSSNWALPGKGSSVFSCLLGNDQA